MDPNHHDQAETVDPAALHNDFFNNSLLEEWFPSSMIDTHLRTDFDDLMTIPQSTHAHVFQDNDSSWAPLHGNASFEDVEDMFGDMGAEEVAKEVANPSQASNTPSPAADPVFSQANSPGNGAHRNTRTGSNSPTVTNDMLAQELKSSLSVTTQEYISHFPIPDAIHIQERLESPMSTSPSPEVHIFADKTKTRAETQIKILVVIDPVEDYEEIHFPRPLLAKPKHLASEEEKKEKEKSGKVLHVSMSLVSAVAVEGLEHRDQAQRRARGEEAFPRRQSTVPISEMDKDDPAHPQNGGEVVICEGCKERERKRYDRKKKRGEDEKEFWSYESERVIMINEKEYKKWKPAESSPGQAFSPLAKQVDFAMRIACYCRHQEEKTPAGYRVIFTFKNNEGDLIAQKVSEVFLITDDHKNKEACHEPLQPIPVQQPFIPPNYAHTNVLPQYPFMPVDHFQPPTMNAYSQPSTPLMSNFQQPTQPSTPLMSSFRQPISPALDGHFAQSNMSAVPLPAQRPANHSFFAPTPIATSFVNRQSQSQSYFEAPMLSPANPSNQASPETYHSRPSSMEAFNFSAGMLQYSHQTYGGSAPHSEPQSAVTTPVTLSRPASPSWDVQGRNKKIPKTGYLY